MTILLDSHALVPFDRMLAAQAQFEDVPLVTADPVFGAFDVRVLW